MNFSLYFFFFFNTTPTTEIYTLSLHDALPIFTNFFEKIVKKESPFTLGTVATSVRIFNLNRDEETEQVSSSRSEEHTSELQSRFDLVCRLLLEKKKQTTHPRTLPSALPRTSGT